MAIFRWWVLLAACGSSGTPAADPPSGESFLPSGASASRLDQTLGSTIAPNLSLACADSLGTTENSWYRVFSLRDAGIVDRVLAVNRVNFGVQTGVGEQRVQISIGLYYGDLPAQTLDLTKIEMYAMSSVMVWPTSSGEMLQANFPATEIPPNATLIVEVHSPAHVRAGDFYLGATTADETAPSYLRAPACNTPDPTRVSILGHPETHVLISVSGSY